VKVIPPTSPDRYITGFDALNIPLTDGTAADWHFFATFIESNGNARLAGVDYPDTSALFGGYGVRECGASLRSSGRPDVSGPVWAADFVRAVLDLVYRSAVVDGVRPDHVAAGDLLDRDSDRGALSAKLAELKSRISDKSRELIEARETKRLA
jgi:hypothetical protein